MSNIGKLRRAKLQEQLLDKLMKLSATDRDNVLEEITEAVRKREVELASWPRNVKLYAHQSKESGRYAGEEIGLDMEEIGSWCPLYEVEIIAEVQENGEHKLLAVNGFTIDYDRPFKGPIFDPEDH